MKHLKPGRTDALVIAIVAVVIILAIVGWFLFGKKKDEPTPVVEEQTQKEELVETLPDPEPVVIETVDAEPVLIDTHEVEEYEPQKFHDPVALMAQVKTTVSSQDVGSFFKIVNKRKLSEQQLEKLEEFIEKSDGLELTVREVGEMEINRLARWAISYAGSEDEITFDVKRLTDGLWVVENVAVQSSLPTIDPKQSGIEVQADSLTVADRFVKALLEQDFPLALRYADADSISDARVASLCIMFEEGEYELRKRKPLRSLFQRNGIAAYTANVQATDGAENGQFGLTLERSSDDEPWLVSEINLDQLLDDYIQRVAGGDAYYTPLVKNPEGGDTLALYFEFNEGQLTERAKRQLQIIAKLLKADSSKKLTLSGHADAIGSDDYNNKLSLNRAENVRSYLIESGIDDQQIRILAFGETKPRRDNTTDIGRRANRRTEIYLDF